MDVDTHPYEHQIVSEQFGSLGLITLNRPKALNSLTQQMVEGIDAALDRFEEERDVALVMIAGAGDRGLCAGGDIRMIYETGRTDPTIAETFWRGEYRLNARISRYRKPYLAILDGITMGGGVGIAAHGSHRVATERLKLAMPETGIGFFPDVGATWLLSRGPGELGTYLGLTGEIIGAADAIKAGLADVMVPSSKLVALGDALSSLSAEAKAENISSTIATFAEAPPPSRLGPHHQLIDRAFGYDTIEEIFEALEKESKDFAVATLGVLKSKSPTALKVALRMLRLAKQSGSLEECLDREFSGSAATLRLADFYEGLRAALIDKDRNPRWSPVTVSEVGEVQVAPFFAPHPAPPFGARIQEKQYV